MEAGSQRPQGVKALFASQEVLSRRIVFLPARKADAHSSIPPGLVPLNSPPLVAKPPMPRKAQGKGNGRPDGNGLIGAEARATRPGEDLVLSWAGPRKVGAGLSNLGNTCFLNSVLQSLTYTPPLAAFLESGQHRASCRISSFCALCALEAHVRQALKSSGGVIAPSQLVKNLRSFSKQFRVGRQEDAHEFMRYLLEALHRSCLPPGAVKLPQEKQASFINRAFAGRLRSQVKCGSCGFTSDTYDPFLDLSLEINRADSLEKALKRFTAQEILDGDNRYKCSKCRKKVRAVKQFTIARPPAVLTIQFKRFDGGFGGKIDKKVAFPTTLDLSPFLSPEARAGGSPGAVYNLYSVLVHSGRSTHSGHYYSFVKAPTGMWHVMDDSRVQQVSEKTVLDQRAYIIFYVRKPSGKPVRTPELLAQPKPPSLETRPPTVISTAAKSGSQSSTITEAHPMAEAHLKVESGMKELVAGPSPAEGTPADSKSRLGGAGSVETGAAKSSEKDMGRGGVLLAEGGKSAGQAQGAKDPPAEDVGVPVGRDEGSGEGVEIPDGGEEGADDGINWDQYYTQPRENLSDEALERLYRVLWHIPSTRRYYLAMEMRTRSRVEWGRSFYEELLAKKLEREVSESDSGEEFEAEEKDARAAVGKGGTESKREGRNKEKGRLGSEGEGKRGTRKTKKKQSKKVLESEVGMVAEEGNGPARTGVEKRTEEGRERKRKEKRSREVETAVAGIRAGEERGAREPGAAIPSEIMEERGGSSKRQNGGREEDSTTGNNDLGEAGREGKKRRKKDAQGEGGAKEETKRQRVQSLLAELESEAGGSGFVRIAPDKGHPPDAPQRPNGASERTRNEASIETQPGAAPNGLRAGGADVSGAPLANGGARPRLAEPAGKGEGDVRTPGNAIHVTMDSDSDGDRAGAELDSEAESEREFGREEDPSEGENLSEEEEDVRPGMKRVNGGKGNGQPNGIAPVSANGGTRLPFSPGKTLGQYGFEVPSWDDVQAPGNGAAPQNDVTTSKRRYDDWDQYYDQGKTKKVKTKGLADGDYASFLASQGRHVASAPNGPTGDNPFQSYASEASAAKKGKNRKLHKMRKESAS